MQFFRWNDSRQKYDCYLLPSILLYSFELQLELFLQFDKKYVAKKNPYQDLLLLTIKKTCFSNFNKKYHNERRKNHSPNLFFSYALTRFQTVPLKAAAAAVAYLVASVNSQMTVGNETSQICLRAFKCSSQALHSENNETHLCIIFSPICA